jgi:hypothetical protein
MLLATTTNSNKKNKKITDAPRPGSGLHFSVSIPFSLTSIRRFVCSAFLLLHLFFSLFVLGPFHLSASYLLSFTLCPIQSSKHVPQLSSSCNSCTHSHAPICHAHAHFFSFAPSTFSCQWGNAASALSRHLCLSLMAALLHQFTMH